MFHQMFQKIIQSLIQSNYFSLLFNQQPMSLTSNDNDENDNLCILSDYIQFQHQLQINDNINNTIDFNNNNDNVNVNDSLLQILQFQTNQDQSILQILTNTKKDPIQLSPQQSSPFIIQAELQFIQFFQNFIREFNQTDTTPPQKKNIGFPLVIHISQNLLFQSIRYSLKQYSNKQYRNFIFANRFNIKKQAQDDTHDLCQQAKAISLSCQQICKQYAQQRKKLMCVVQILVCLYRKQMSVPCLMAVLQKLLHNFFMERSIGNDQASKSFKVSYQIIITHYFSKFFLKDDEKQKNQAFAFIQKSSSSQNKEVQKFQKLKPQTINNVKSRDYKKIKKETWTFTQILQKRQWELTNNTPYLRMLEESQNESQKSIAQN